MYAIKWVISYFYPAETQLALPAPDPDSPRDAETGRVGRIRRTRSRRKKGISQQMRLQLWRNYYGDGSTGNCYCCNHPIRYTDFQCGHVMAESLGGPTEIVNLRPICGACNTAMGVENLDEYRARVHPDAVLQTTRSRYCRLLQQAPAWRDELRTLLQELNAALVVEADKAALAVLADRLRTG